METSKLNVKGTLTDSECLNLIFNEDDDARCQEISQNQAVTNVGTPCLVNVEDLLFPEDATSSMRISVAGNEHPPDTYESDEVMEHDLGREDIIDEVIIDSEKEDIPESNQARQKRQCGPKRQSRHKTGGRPKATIWSSFVVTIVKGQKICECKVCGKKVSSKADRLVKHKDECAKNALWKQRRLISQSVSVPTSVSVPDSEDSSEQSLKVQQQLMTSFFDKMSAPEKLNVDRKVAKLIFNRGLPFDIAEDEDFRDLLSALRPSYKPPDRKTISGRFLNEAYAEKTEKLKNLVGGSKVTLMQDGWSSIQNDPIIVHAFSDGARTVFLNAVDTEDNKKTSKYCLKLLKEAKQLAEETFGVEVIGCVTDNCGTMKKLRKMFVEEFADMAVYGCNTHLLNLIGRDLSNKKLLDDVISIHKLFRNHHYEHALLKKMKGKLPVLPAETRWNSQLNSLQSYVENHAKYLEISRDPGSVIFEDVYKKSIIQDGIFFTEVVSLIGKIKPLAESLTKLEAEDSHYADAIAVWLDLRANMTFISDAEEEMFQNRFKMAVTNVGIVAYMLHPKYRGKSLNPEELEQGRSWLYSRNPYYVVYYSHLQTLNADYFPKSMVSSEVLESLDPCSWWKAIMESSDQFTPSFAKLCDCLMRLPASTSGLERALSTMGSLNSKNRNRMKLERLEKVCFVKYHKSIL